MSTYIYNKLSNLYWSLTEKQRQQVHVKCESGQGPYYDLLYIEMDDFKRITASAQKHWQLRFVKRSTIKLVG